jgi:hypothetical protein
MEDGGCVDVEGMEKEGEDLHRMAEHETGGTVQVGGGECCMEE